MKDAFISRSSAKEDIVEVTVESPVETETPVPHASATDQHSSSGTEELPSAVPNSNVVLEQAIVASEQLLIIHLSGRLIQSETYYCTEI